MDRFEVKENVTHAYLTAVNRSNIELYGRIKAKRREVEPIHPLIDFIVERLCATSDLALRGLVWDSEIICRSALESLFKLTFITTVEGEERENRLREYWLDLAEINRLKQSEQAKKNLLGLGHIETMRLAYSALILDEDDEERLKAKWPRRLRQAVEQKWSFSEMLKEIMRTFPPSIQPAFAGFAHQYHMASHITYGDETGILIIAERNQRTLDEQEVVNTGHYVRLLSDCLAFCTWTAKQTMRFLGEDDTVFNELFTSVSTVKGQFQFLNREVLNDSMYDRFRSTSTP